jgi:hypothetical protein
MDRQDKTSADMRDDPPPDTVPLEEKSVPTADSHANATAGGAELGEREKKKKRTVEEKCVKKCAKGKSKKHKRLTAVTSSSESSNSDTSVLDSDSYDSVSDVEKTKKKKKKTATKKRRESINTRRTQEKKHKGRYQKQQETASDSSSDSDDDDEDGVSDEEKDDRNSPLNIQDLNRQVLMLTKQIQALQQPSLQAGNPYQYNMGPGSMLPPIYDQGLQVNTANTGRSYRFGNLASRRGGQAFAGIELDPPQARKTDRERAKSSKGTKMSWKRVDQVWDNTIHNYKLQNTSEGVVDEKMDDFLFHIRRTFDFEGQYRSTVVDCKSHALRECLQEVMGNIKGVSLVEETPKIDPNLLFL